MRSEKEIRDHLHQKDYEYIEIAIERLKKNRMINDEEYARSFVRTTFQLKNEGPKKIERELRQKGLTQEEILSGLEEYSWEIKNLTKNVMLNILKMLWKIKFVQLVTVNV